jgi:hypothetical protein
MRTLKFMHFIFCCLQNLLKGGESGDVFGEERFLWEHRLHLTGGFAAFGALRAPARCAGRGKKK